MNEDDRLHTYLRIWKDVYTERIQDEAPDTNHLTDEDLYGLAQDGGMDRADSEAVEHLSRCPVCMEKWADWREAISSSGEDDTETVPCMTFGLLKAAAAHHMEPLRSYSSCGRFSLGILPETDDPDWCLLTLDVVDEAGIGFEGDHVVIRDRMGHVLMKGKIHQGRLAHRLEYVSEMDFSTWTLVVDKRK